MTECDFVRGVKVRCNLPGTKVRSVRGREADDVSSDLCHRQPKSLGHMLYVNFTRAKLLVGGQMVLVETPIPTLPGF